jgi:hypothetical protein
VGWLDAASGCQVRIGDGGRVVRLRQPTGWLDRHEAARRTTVDEWMVRSLPVPTTLLTEVWADAAWDADAARGLGVVPLDGDTRLST